MSDQTTQKNAAQQNAQNDPWHREGYIYWKHNVDGVELVFYIEQKENTSWVHAFEGAFDYASMFRNKIQQLRQQEAEKKSESKESDNK